MSNLHVAQSPCTSCPYRKDTPSGIWHPTEYEKLRGYDDPQTAFGVFLCHYSLDSDRDTVCRGWLSVACESVAVRLAVLQGTVKIEQVRAPVAEPLYASGNEAADAGLRGVRRPGKKARQVAARLAKSPRRKIG